MTQLEADGGVVVVIAEDGKIRDVPIREGEVFLLAPHIHHSPRPQIAEFED